MYPLVASREQLIYFKLLVFVLHWQLVFHQYDPCNIARRRKWNLSRGTYPPRCFFLVCFYPRQYGSWMISRDLNPRATKTFTENYLHMLSFKKLRSHRFGSVVKNAKGRNFVGFLRSHNQMLKDRGRINKDREQTSWNVNQVASDSTTLSIEKVMSYK